MFQCSLLVISLILFESIVVMLIVITVLLFYIIHKTRFTVQWNVCVGQDYENRLLIWNEINVNIVCPSRKYPLHRYVYTVL